MAVTAAVEEPKIESTTVVVGKKAKYRLPGKTWKQTKAILKEGEAATQNPEGNNGKKKKPEDSKHGGKKNLNIPPEKIAAQRRWMDSKAQASRDWEERHRRKKEKAERYDRDG